MLRGVLVGVSPTDPITLMAVAAGLTVVAMLACLVPAWRVLRIEPARALRDGQNGRVTASPTPAS